MNNRWTKQRLKEAIGLHTNIPWDIVYLEVFYSKIRIARIFINGHATPFFAEGYGYDKTGTVLEQFISYYINEKLGIDGAAGVPAVIEKAEQKNIKLEFVCEAKNSFIYKVSNLGGSNAKI